ncbi:MAG: AEC family transporter [Cyanobacteria bacterium J06639_1]
MGKSWRTGDRGSVNEAIGTLLKLYIPLIGFVGLGVAAQRMMSDRWRQRIGPQALGRFLYWIGIPISLVGFLRGADLSGAVWAAPACAWGAILLAWGLSRAWLRLRDREGLSLPQQGSFQIASMLGNTGYVGYPICLAVGGTTYFAWALFYDILGTAFGSFGLGVWVAGRCGRNSHLSQGQVLKQMLTIPALWGFAVGMATRTVELPIALDSILLGFAWSMVPLSLIAMGMRLAQLRSWQGLQKSWAAISIKILAVPISIGAIAHLLPLPPMGSLLIALQAGMPSAFSTLVLAEEFGLDREMTVAAIAGSSLLVLLTLPIWLLLWGQGAISG